MKTFLGITSTLILAASANEVPSQVVRDLQFSVDVSVGVDRACDWVRENVPAFSNCDCDAQEYNILDLSEFWEVQIFCDISLPFGFTLRTQIRSERLDNFALGFMFIPGDNSFIPSFSYSFPFVDFFPFRRALEASPDEKSISEQTPATPHCEVTYDGKHCLCSVCETSKGEKGYSTFCGQLPDHLPETWRRLNEECVALEDLEYVDQAFEIMASLREFRDKLP